MRYLGADSAAVLKAIRVDLMKVVSNFHQLRRTSIAAILCLVAAVSRCDRKPKHPVTQGQHASQFQKVYEHATQVHRICPLISSYDDLIIERTTKSIRVF